MKTKYPANIAKGYTYSFLSWFGITGLWVMYLQTKGLNLVEVGLCESIFHVASFIFEVPSGIIADRFSYRFGLFWGRVAAIASALIILLSHHFWLFALGFVLSALSYNLQSGTIDALLYDSLITDKLTVKYPQVTSNIDVVIEFAQTGGVVIAGFLVHWHFELTYVIAIFTSIFGIITVLLFKEPQVGKSTNPIDKQTISVIVKTAYQVFKRNQQLRNLMLFDAFFAGVCTTYFYYFQSFMETTHFSGWMISALMVLSALINIIGIRLTPRIQRQFSKQTLILLLSCSLAIVLILSWITWTPLLIALFLASQLLGSLITPIFSNYYNTMIASEQRATLLSVASILFSFVMIGMFPFMGWLVQRSGFSVAFGSIGLVIIGILIVMQRTFRVHL
ncbi:MFS transporter [Lentilactobacillus kisonensis]|uniref:Transporter, major facilitator family protein n=1 Tax=Lentilactobacillus kisonensis F0435 TaxID=797516 RepID=H1LHU6_9LACO|nr:MFS transporter [Lentilactobacillus kisonensis]EHO50182.1 transporter, major facilitator family protein [Lentilactobacillus kisonensis F0435]